jgi:multicomponent Na+:H+ antiporter subunit D
MSFDAWLPAAIVLSSMIPGMLIFLLREESHRLRTLLNMTGALVKLAW